MQREPLDDLLTDPVHSPFQARKHLLLSLRREVLGPGSDTEVLHESPLTRYITGQLAPAGTRVPDEEQDEQNEEGDDDDIQSSSDSGAPLTQALTPSSIGLSIIVGSDVRQLDVRVTWGEYTVETEDAEIGENDDNDIDGELEGDTVSDSTDTGGDSGDSSRRRRRRPRLRWRRTSHDSGVITLSLRPGEGLISHELGGTKLALEQIARKVDKRLAVSVFLVNRRERGDVESRPPLDRWIFQPVLFLGGTESKPIFLRRDTESRSGYPDPDAEANRLLYRFQKEFATGHGCAANWQVADGSDKAGSIWTELMPTHEVPRMRARASTESKLRMRELAEATSGEEHHRLLAPLLAEYRRWIHEQRLAANQLGDGLKQVALTHIDDCEKAADRIKGGLDVLCEDKDALLAFRFANRAMLLQRAHSHWGAQRRKADGSAPTQPVLDGTWYPFQLAFILMNIRAIARPLDERNERNIGDLLWFPTGGGKTEAYLGLASFTMALRRLRSEVGMRTDAGVAVLMRYTLRLLTIQQFQRAATLLCACEILRREDPQRWGTYRFSIGLWLGKKGTPNSHDDSRRALGRLQADPSEEGASPCVLESCPWCGERLTERDYWIDGDKKRTFVACKRPACEFSRTNSQLGIPVVTVDEEIYRECPSLLLGTVDKFAQMPWNAEVQALFGFVDRECNQCGFLASTTDHPSTHRRGRQRGVDGTVRTSSRLAPPDLIIQDELHLISGPLGTLVGLYETAIDYLASRRIAGRDVRPKVVASTATVRRAYEQVQAIFDRPLSVFPPPGLTAADSFFAVEEAPSADAPGRLYVGLSATGKSMKTAYVRTASALLSAGAGIKAIPAAAESYLTLVSYFNSLRELGGARRLLDDDIPARLDQLKRQGRPARQRPVYEEMTSRVRQELIPQLLRRLELRHDANQSPGDLRPLDVVIASNMISVGVDIDRLGLMTVTGQPKTTAEYIQATSRVGRQASGPGLVVTIYNWSRPRDLSHYERFKHYHSTLYSSVEAVSATPFSSRALDRGLRGVYVSMARLGTALAPELGASRFDPGDPGANRVEDAIVRRATAVLGESARSTVVAAVRALADQWWGYRTHPLRYSWRAVSPDSRPQEDVLMRSSEQRTGGHWAVPQSLREVEDVSFVRILGTNDS